MDLRPFIRDIPDFPKPGVLFKDITTLLKDGAAFHELIDMVTAHYRDRGVTKVVGIEARGFIFASALAYNLGVGMVPARKPGKLPAPALRETYELEYGSDAIEIHRDAIGPGDRVVVLDDVIATGGTLVSACRLVKSLGGEVLEAATIFELSFLPGREKLKDFNFHSFFVF